MIALRVRAGYRDHMPTGGSKEIDGFGVAAIVSEVHRPQYQVAARVWSATDRWLGGGIYSLVDSKENVGNAELSVAGLGRRELDALAILARAFVNPRMILVDKARIPVAGIHIRWRSSLSGSEDVHCNRFGIRSSAGGGGDAWARES